MKIWYSVRFGTNGRLQIQSARLFSEVICSQIAYSRGHQLVNCGLDTNPAKYFSGLNDALEKYCSRIDQYMKKV